MLLQKQKLFREYIFCNDNLVVYNVRANDVGLTISVSQAKPTTMSQESCCERDDLYEYVEKDLTRQIRFIWIVYPAFQLRF